MIGKLCLASKFITWYSCRIILYCGLLESLDTLGTKKVGHRLRTFANNMSCICLVFYLREFEKRKKRISDWIICSVCVYIYFDRSEIHMLVTRQGRRGGRNLEFYCHEINEVKLDLMLMMHRFLVCILPLLKWLTQPQTASLHLI